jgi:hypothetical protein
LLKDYAPLPNLVAHADWGSHPQKRWVARAALSPEGVYIAHAPQPAGPAESFLNRLRAAGGKNSCILVGFDFPIGLPFPYARLAGIKDFLSLLPELGGDKWVDFYRPAASPDEISLYRPFYPARPGNARQVHLIRGLGVNSMGDLMRLCDLPQPGRRAACSIFWTMGPQQVGKAAIHGWKEVIAPALHRKDPPAVWPFHGPLASLLGPGKTVLAETYPTEMAGHIGIHFSARGRGLKWGKRSPEDRKAKAGIILGWAEQHGVLLDAELRSAVQSGFGASPNGEDAFDAAVALFGMLNVLVGSQPPGDPPEGPARDIEGWILGQPIPEDGL